MTNSNDPPNGRRSHYQREAYKATQQFRSRQTQPAGVDVHHLNKVGEAQKASIPTQTMNQNLLPLQSDIDKPATTLHTSPRGQGTGYTVHDHVTTVNDDRKAKPLSGPQDVNRDLSPARRTYGTEHKFADQYLHKQADARSRAANPHISNSDRIEAGGATVGWQLTGHPTGRQPNGQPGKVSPHVAREININKGESFTKAGPNNAANQPRQAQNTRNPPRQNMFATDAKSSAIAEWQGKTNPVNPGKGANNISPSTPTASPSSSSDNNSVPRPTPIRSAGPTSSDSVSVPRPTAGSSRFSGKATGGPSGVPASSSSNATGRATGVGSAMGPRGGPGGRMAHR